MKINMMFDCVEGSFDTETDQLVSVSSHKYRSVELAMKSPGSMSVGFAQIRLHSKNLFVQADAVFEDATKLGDEIARRWNEFRVVESRAESAEARVSDLKSALLDKSPAFEVLMAVQAERDALKGEAK